MLLQVHILDTARRRLTVIRRKDLFNHVKVGKLRTLLFAQQ